MRRAPKAPGGRVLLVGSSLVELGVLEEVLREQVRTLAPKLELEIYKMAEFGALASDVYVITRNALAVRPDLVVYGTSPRDYPLPEFADPRETVTFEILGNHIDLELLKLSHADESISRFVRKHWLLYRYRHFFHGYFQLQLQRIKRQLNNSFARPVHAREGAGAPTIGEQASPHRDLSAFLKWLTERKPPEYLEVMRKINRTNYRPAGNPQLALVRRWTSICVSHSARPVIVMMPENPLLKQEPTPFFDAQLSSEVRTVLGSVAREGKAGFYDLRSYLPAEQFDDVSHVNRRGALTLSKRFAEIIVREIATIAAGTEVIGRRGSDL